MNRPNWGGRREGAGRPALDGAKDLKETMVMLSSTHSDIAKSLGRGNVSLGIRRALDFYQKCGNFTTEPKSNENTKSENQP